MVPTLKKYLPDCLITLFLFLLSTISLLYKLDLVTPGISYDEIGYATIGERLIESGKFVVFSDDGFAPPTPYLYLQGTIVKLLERSIVSIRLPSVLFGSLAVAASYIFLRQAFKKFASISGALVLIVLYHFVIISRLGYEMSMAVFSEFMSLLYIYRSYKKNKTLDYIGAAVFIAAGLYSYLAFRTTAVSLMLVLTLIVIRKSKDLMSKLKSLFVVYGVFFIVLIPIISYTIRNPAHVFARASAISVFNQNLPAAEIAKEIFANAKLSFGMFLFTGSNNPILNPGMTTMYDKLFILVAVVGLLYLFRKNKVLALTGLFLMVPSFVNDIFSYEPVPGTRFYGMGHPATTRVIGFIPILIFFFTSGLVSLDKIINKIKPKSIRLVATVGLVLLIGYIGWHNWNLYFNQKPNEYIYYANHVSRLDVVHFVNQGSISETKKVVLSKILFDDPVVKYFADKEVILIPIEFSEDDLAFSQIPSGVFTLIDVYTAKVLSNQLTDEQFQKENNVNVWALPPSPWGKVSTLIAYRN